MSNLSDSIKELYDDMTEAEANHAAHHLVSLFKVLQEVDSRLAHEKSNEQKNDNIGSAD
ncbi:MAG: hypothetical protein O2970_11930 [Proteobacteria bacterium]|nr:hypothetical protein [Pseudomonadota bacterium]MDA0967646.1 hypothetical protein [Pseudomonadota bacterium]MDG4544510.1 hypothetical protein [Rickettsiales bacterium]